MHLLYIRRCQMPCKFQKETQINCDRVCKNRSYLYMQLCIFKDHNFLCEKADNPNFA